MSRTKPAAGREEDVGFAFVEVMACPGGCTNGGGQIRVGEQEALRAAAVVSASSINPVSSVLHIARANMTIMSSPAANRMTAVIAGQ